MDAECRVDESHRGRGEIAKKQGNYSARPYAHFAISRPENASRASRIVSLAANLEVATRSEARRVPSGGRSKPVRRGPGAFDIDTYLAVDVASDSARGTRHRPPPEQDPAVRGGAGLADRAQRIRPPDAIAALAALAPDPDPDPDQ